jgi:hypothetical protein
MAMNACDMYRLASEFAAEHGEEAPFFARRAVVTLRAEGAVERARFWYLLATLLDDIVIRHVDPDATITYH